MPPPINSQYDSFAFALVLTQVNKPATHQSGAVPPGYGQPKGRNKAVTTVQRPDESWPYWGSPHPGHTVAGGGSHSSPRATMAVCQWPPGSPRISSGLVQPSSSWSMRLSVMGILLPFRQGGQIATYTDFFTLSYLVLVHAHSSRRLLPVNWHRVTG